MKTIYLAGGCFWGTQKFFDQFSAVVETEVGYANGNTESPTYQEVCYHNTGHAETVRVVYDETRLPTQKLLEYYFLTIDPLAVNHQGGDFGTQYRTGIYFTDPSLEPDIRAAVAHEVWNVGHNLAVEVEPLRNFYPAEESHQKYLEKRPYGYCHIRPELFRLEEEEST